MSDDMLIVPVTIEEGGNFPTIDRYEEHQSMENREIWLDSEIDETSGTLNIVKQIIRWNREDLGIPIESRVPIRLFINSPGGSIYMTNTLIDAIDASETPVWGINVGMAFSGGAFTFIACHKRFMLKNAYFLFHQGSGALAGDYSKMSSQWEEYRKQVDTLSKIVKKYTTYNDSEVERNIVTEWSVYADEALENGVCDVIINKISDIYK